jgi:hypothetical protein
MKIAKKNSAAAAALLSAAEPTSPDHTLGTSTATAVTLEEGGGSVRGVRRRVLTWCWSCTGTTSPTNSNSATEGSGGGGETGQVLGVGSGSSVVVVGVSAVSPYTVGVSALFHPLPSTSAKAPPPQTIVLPFHTAPSKIQKTGVYGSIWCCCCYYWTSIRLTRLSQSLPTATTITRVNIFHCRLKKKMNLFSRPFPASFVPPTT